jgi:hypothetical protein
MATAQAWIGFLPLIRLGERDSAALGSRSESPARRKEAAQVTEGMLEDKAFSTVLSGRRHQSYPGHPNRADTDFA